MEKFKAKLYLYWGGLSRLLEDGELDQELIDTAFSDLADELGRPRPVGRPNGKKRKHAPKHH